MRIRPDGTLIVVYIVKYRCSEFTGSMNRSWSSLKHIIHDCVVVRSLGWFGGCYWFAFMHIEELASRKKHANERYYSKALYSQATDLA